MKQKVLLLRANPRKTGFTQRLGDWFLAGLREAGAKVRDVDVPALGLNPCLGCFHCWLVEPGQCVHGDAMSAQLEYIREATVVVCATPIYYYSMSAYLKTYFERTFPLAKPGIQVSGKGLTRNSIRHLADWKDKKFISIITGALRDPEAYRPATETFQLIADSLDMELGGQLTRPECYLLDYPLSKPKTLKRVEAAFIQAGREAGTTGRLSTETMQAAALPLAADLNHYRTYSNYYWTWANDMGEEALEPSNVQRRVATDARILMREMVRSHDAKATARVKAVLQFEFPDRQLVYSVRLNADHCELAETGVANPDLRVTCNSTVWSAVFMRQLDLREALRNGSLRLAGDKSLFTRLDRFFPPPSE
ncbi:MAG: NAD(P)H-dependent oxidoreductase [Verrucomicrobiota bacterium]